MDRRAGKMVMLGTVLAVMSFLVGLFQSSLPTVLQLFGDTFITAVLACSYCISTVIMLALTTAVYGTIFLFMSPAGVLSILATLWIVLRRKPQFSQT
ncbi:MAG: hypothetical protein IT343_21385 [Candidatus Melainabacteria bacterium]|jgi:hypothetical protein|nr:hypothetical protein [Candidatus Melainabacteria bacterium]